MELHDEIVNRLSYESLNKKEEDMKKILIGALVVFMTMGFIGCDSDNGGNGNNGNIDTKVIAEQYRGEYDSDDESVKLNLHDGFDYCRIKLEEKKIFMKIGKKEGSNVIFEEFELISEIYYDFYTIDNKLYNDIDRVIGTFNEDGDLVAIDPNGGERLPFTATYKKVN